MKRHAYALAAALMLGSAGPLLLPGSAQAAPAYVTGHHFLHAGPGTAYPAVAELEPGVMVEVLGCLEGYGWCDVVIGESRGWIAGQFLEAMQRQRRYPLLGVAPSIGVPIIGFSVDSYWDRNYRNREWYRDRDRWAGRPPPPGFYGGPPPRGHDGPPRGYGGGPPPHFDRGPGRPDWDRGPRGGPPPGHDGGDRGPGRPAEFRGGPPDRGPDWGGRGGRGDGGPHRGDQGPRGGDNRVQPPPGGRGGDGGPPRGERPQRGGGSGDSGVLPPPGGRGGGGGNPQP
jgi:uncharacterized protein YraI